MKIGFNLLLWTTYVTENHWSIIENLKVTGYDGVEVPIFEGVVSHYEELGRRLKDIGLASTGVGVMPGGGKNAISADPRQREGALDHIKWLTDCTAAIGGDILCGPFHQPLGEFSGKGPTGDEVTRCAEVHKAAAQYAASAGITFAIEPLNRFECYFLNTAAQAVALAKAVDEHNYGYLFDTFHTNIEENSIVEVILSTIRQISHVHISENNRGTPGAGHIDFTAVFKALKAAGYDGWLTVEAFGSSLPDLAAATKIWRPLFARPEDVYEGAYSLIRRGWDNAA
ncbi:MAG: sugar phosphate isomerase/epimerase [Cucumibacter sp.]